MRGMFIAIRRALLVLLALAVLLPPAAVHAQRAPAPAYQGPQDLEIPNGYFFTQAAPGQNGAGYRVANEAGIPFWDEFRRHGGLPALGYPVSRRFIWRDTVVQMFQFGALQWHGAEIGAEVRSPGEVGNPPTHARRAEPMPR